MATEFVSQIAKSILHGFNRHFIRFQEITLEAKQRFETADWDGEVQANKDRIDFYDKRVSETVDYITERYNLGIVDKTLWENIKRQYMWMLYEHKQPELAESFYNSVFCHLFDRSYFNNQHIFVKPGSAVDFIDMDDTTYLAWYPDTSGLRLSFSNMLKSFELKNSWENLDRDLDLLVENFTPQLATDVCPMPFRQLQVVSSLFFRNKAAYIVGRALVGHNSKPFVIPLLLTQSHQLYVDTILTNAGDIAVVFSFTHAYFMVSTEVPSALVSFLEKILPTRNRAELYTSIGFQKQGKTLFYRDFLYHLKHSTDKLIIAPGIKGMVMTVFTLPSYPFVFKVIKDEFSPPKNIDRKTVRLKYHMVKTHDRIGRMADTLEFSHVAFPIHRFSDELLEELKQTAASSLTIETDYIIIRHVYIERRMIPLNIFLETAKGAMREKVVMSYGYAIKEMIAANIFPGDMLLKNFGVTRFSRVIFYDYDEIRPLTEIRIRAIPQARFEEEELSSEVWFHVDDDDFFPEQFEQFVMYNAKFKKKFVEYHPELLQPAYWKNIQQDVLNKKRHEVFPYRQKRRFRSRYPELYS